MSNNFNIIISATDKTASGVRKINDRISKLTRPLSNVQKSANALGKELGRNPVIKVLNGVRKMTGGVAVGVAKVGVAMTAVVGVGTIAGVAALATEWGRLGFEIGQTSKNIGVTTSDLQSLRGAAELAGVSSEALTGSLKTLGDTMEDALFGRNQNAVLMLNKIGVGIHKTADGSIDTARAFKDIANYVASIKNAQVQGLVARQFGLEALLPLLRKGKKGIEEYQRKIAEFGGVSTQKGIDAAEQFGLQLNYLSAATHGLKITIGASLMPALQPMITGLTQWISLNRQAIGDKVGQWAKNFGEWIQTVDWDKFLERVNAVGKAIIWLVDQLQKLEKIKPSEYFFGVMPKMPAGIFPDDKNNKGKGQSSSGMITVNPATNSATSVALSGHQPLGIRTNNPLNMQPGGKQATFGTPQEGITAGVRNILKNYQGLTLAQFVHKYTPGNGAGNTPQAEANYLSSLSAKTGIQANQIPNLRDANVLAPLISAMIQNENGKNPYDSSMVNNTVQHAIEITLNGFPTGATATAKSKDGKASPVRINASMPVLGG